jgi:hypothetical protein
VAQRVSTCALIDESINYNILSACGLVFLDMVRDPCASFPCMNGALCAVDDTAHRITYICRCSDGFSGRNCELRRLASPQVPIPAGMCFRSLDKSKELN